MCNHSPIPAGARRGSNCTSPTLARLGARCATARSEGPRGSTDRARRLFEPLGCPCWTARYTGDVHWASNGCADIAPIKHRPDAIVRC